MNKGKINTSGNASEKRWFAIPRRKCEQFSELTLKKYVTSLA
jgi:hypothetical protein